MTTYPPAAAAGWGMPDQPPPWPTTYSLDRYVSNPCECSPSEATTIGDLQFRRRVYIAGPRNPNCPVHWDRAAAIERSEET